jgi:cellulose synthase/poly-beta-1,6-N-acetylglucosamine synthase-like glycosyltransferase
MTDSQHIDARGVAPSSRRSSSHRYKFAFIIPAYAGKRNAQGERPTAGFFSLARCLDSIAAQTDPDCRIILVNDGNSVEMGQMAQEYQKAMPHIPVTYLQAPYRGQRGGHESVNIALSVLPQDVDFVTILNGDNTIRPAYIEKMYHPEHDIITCMVQMNDLPGITLNGLTFARARVDRLNYAVRAGIARATKHKMHMDADCDFVIDCLAMAENGVYNVMEVLGEHN